MTGLSKRALSLTSATAVVALLAGLALLAKSPLIQMPGWDDPDPVITIRPDEPPPPADPEPAQPRTPRIEQTLAPAPPQPIEPLAPAEPWAGPLPPADAGAGAAFEPGPPVIENPRWRARPRDLGRYYPRRAAAAGREGVVLLDCMVRVTGRLDCVVASETPQGWSFGQAALNIARDHNMAPATRDGVAVEARYRMRVPFNLD